MRKDLATWRFEDEGIESGSSVSADPDSGRVTPLKWATDRESGRIRYIHSLSPDENGKRCNCICGHCRLPLTAVNAGKTAFTMTPHFRHPDNALKDACVVLAARAAALEALREIGVMELPRRRMSRNAIGLSGAGYEAWVDAPAEKVSILEAVFRDRTTALLTLDDGRQLVVELTGSIAGTSLLSKLKGNEVAGDVEVPAAMISVNLSDPQLASLGLEEIISRLTLLPNIRWCRHWADADLGAQALAEAKQLADDALDWLDGRRLDEVPGLTEAIRDLPPEEARIAQRESLLHLEVKDILARANHLRLPALRVEAFHQVADERAETLFLHWSRPEEVVHLKSVALEQRLGRIVPDVVAELAPVPQPDLPIEAPEPILLIEVTVTNNIDDERLRRIEAEDLPALEIAISRLGGKVTREGLERIVTEEVALKRWLYHPAMAEQRQRLTGELAHRAHLREEAHRLKLARRDAALAQRPEHWASLYVDAVREHSIARTKVQDHPYVGPEPFEEVRQKKAGELDRIKEAADALSLHGWPQAQDDKLYLYWGCMLDRILSIKLNMGVGYRVASGFEVLNAIRQEAKEHRQWHTIYLIAARAFDIKRHFNAKQLSWLADWRAQVRRSIDGKVIGADPAEYLRPSHLDGFLGLLFPEMRPGLVDGYGRRLELEENAVNRISGRTTVLP